MFRSHPPNALAIALFLSAALGGGARAELPNFMPLWNWEHADSTEAKFKALLPEAEASGDRDYLAQLLTQIARTQGLQQQFEEAHRTLDRAQSLLRADMPKARVRYLLERGRTHNSSGNPSEARSLFLAAWNLGREAKLDDLAIDAAHMMAIASPPVEALEWNDRAIAYAEQTTDPKARGWLGPLYNNQAWAYHDLADYEKALDLFQRGLRFRETEGGALEIRIAKWSVARCLRSLNRVTESLEIQEALAAELETSGEQDGYVDEELGECLLLLGRAEEARPHFVRAYELLSQDIWLARDEQPRLERLRALGAGETPVEQDKP